MKDSVSPGVVYIAVSAAEPGVCRIGRAVGQSAEARVRQWSGSNPAIAPWHVFAKRSVRDVSACLSEVHRRLERHRDPVRARGREMFRVAPEKAQMILQSVARRLPPTTQHDEEETSVPESIQDDDKEALLVAPIQDGEPPIVTPVQEHEEELPVVAPRPVENIADEQDDPREKHEVSGAGDQHFQPAQASVIRDPYPGIGAALVALFIVACAWAGLAVIPLGLSLLGVFWFSILHRRSIRRLQQRGIALPAVVSASPEGLAVNGRLLSPSSALRAGFVVPDEPRGALVLLERERWWPLMLRVGSARDARRVLRALGLDASRRAVTRRVACGTLTIGVDGIACSGTKGQDFFFSIAEVKDVSTYHTARVGGGGGGTGAHGSGGGTVRGIPAQWGIDLALQDGRSVRMPLVEDENDPSLLGLVEERIRECIELSRSGPFSTEKEPDDDDVLIGRRGRASSGWLRSLRASANAGYRAVAVDSERLSRLLGNAKARPSARAAAALVLAASGDAQATAKLRVAAESIANHRVRVALENIAGASDDDAVAEALQALDETDREKGTA